MDLLMNTFSRLRRPEKRRCGLWLSRLRRPVHLGGREGQTGLREETPLPSRGQTGDLPVHGRRPRRTSIPSTASRSSPVSTARACRGCALRPAAGFSVEVRPARPGRTVDLGAVPRTRQVRRRPVSAAAACTPTCRPTRRPSSRCTRASSSSSGHQWGPGPCTAWVRTTRTCPASSPFGRRSRMAARPTTAARSSRPSTRARPSAAVSARLAPWPRQQHPQSPAVA